MLVYIQRNYNYPDLLRQTPGNTGKWDDIQFTLEDTKECDFVIVLNHPSKDIKIKCKKGGKILIIQEPPYNYNNYLKLHARFYDKIISGFQNEGDFTTLNSQAALPWHVDRSYDELSNYSTDSIIEKKDKVSWITSNANLFPQHKIRLAFIDYMKNHHYDFDLYGRGFQPIKDKFDGISPYKYTIAAENYIGKDYFTEKIIDAYLSMSMPIYAGCSNITKYFPEESLVQIDMSSPENALNKIKHAVENKLWDKNVDAIRYARELVLNKYQLFPMITEYIKKRHIEINSNKYSNIYLPFNGLTKYETFKKNIKHIFERK